MCVAVGEQAREMQSLIATEDRPQPSVLLLRPLPQFDIEFVFLNNASVFLGNVGFTFLRADNVHDRDSTVVPLRPVSVVSRIEFHTNRVIEHPNLVRMTSLTIETILFSASC